MSNTKADARTVDMFAPEHVREQPAPVLELEGGPSLRVVYWTDEDGEESERPCLVRCDGGERNIVRVRKLVTLCGTSCVEATRTSAIQPSKDYCQTCVASAGNGVLR